MSLAKYFSFIEEKSVAAIGPPLRRFLNWDVSYRLQILKLVTLARVKNLFQPE